jgi:hypothetical protein
MCAYIVYIHTYLKLQTLAGSEPSFSHSFGLAKTLLTLEAVSPPLGDKKPVLAIPFEC